MNSEIIMGKTLVRNQDSTACLMMTNPEHWFVLQASGDILLFLGPTYSFSLITDTAQ